MLTIYFVGNYKPMMCGIADYTNFIVREIPRSRAGVLSFALDKCGIPLTIGHDAPAARVWYGIPGPRDFSAPAVLSGIEELGGSSRDSVLWFQHEFGIWPDSERFVSMLRELRPAKVVTFHSLHFQSEETPSGLRDEEYRFLRELLPHVQAITVFSRGVHQAVAQAFPQWRQKTHLIRHGIHAYGHASRLGRREAKQRLADFVLHESDLEQTAKESLRQRHSFLDPDTILIGQTGFLCPSKHSELLYTLQGALQRLLPSKNIIAMRIGTPRDNTQKDYAADLRREHNGTSKFLLESFMPGGMLPVAQRAFDINFFWPRECTQSGILSHALGAGATIAGRDLEGLGETIADAGGLTDNQLSRLTAKIMGLIANPELASIAERKALAYAEKLSWANQARRHYDLAERISHPVPYRIELSPVSRLARRVAVPLPAGS